jgi:8-oxo-dGTP pyrophosphatase MutT (NUDIX family)
MAEQPQPTPQPQAEAAPQPQTAPQPWSVLSSRTIVHDRWLRLEAERVRTSSGVVIEPWYLAHSHRWACALALTPDRRVVMVEQYRRGVDAWVMEFPAGNIDDNEEPATAALRELVEESGYRSISAPIALGAWWPEPAHNSACAHGFIVQVAQEPGAQSPGIGEILHLRLESIAGVEEAIRAGRLCHGVQIAFWYAARSRGLI